MNCCLRYLSLLLLALCHSAALASAFGSWEERVARVQQNLVNCLPILGEFPDPLGAVVGWVYRDIIDAYPEFNSEDGVEFMQRLASPDYVLQLAERIPLDCQDPIGHLIASLKGDFDRTDRGGGKKRTRWEEEMDEETQKPVPGMTDMPPKRRRVHWGASISAPVEVAGCDALQPVASFGFSGNVWGLSFSLWCTETGMGTGNLTGNLTCSIGGSHPVVDLFAGDVEVKKEAVEEMAEEANEPATVKDSQLAGRTPRRMRSNSAPPTTRWSPLEPELGVAYNYQDSWSEVNRINAMPPDQFYLILNVRMNCVGGYLSMLYYNLLAHLSSSDSSDPATFSAIERINTAFATLSDPQTRTHYDKYGVSY